MYKIPQDMVRRVAMQYGFRVHERVVTENVQQAEELHGQMAPNFDGNLRRFWGCDRDGRYDAVKLLDGYLSQMAYEADCDGKAARDFEDQAYGLDR